MTGAKCEREVAFCSAASYTTIGQAIYYCKGEGESWKLNAKVIGAAKEGGSLEELSEGYMGKVLVYKSGAVKLKLGDALYDVSHVATAFPYTKTKAQHLPDGHLKFGFSSCFDTCRFHPAQIVYLIKMLLQSTLQPESVVFLESSASELL